MAATSVEQHSVVIVGAGLAGLYAAKLLRPHFPDVIVLEATDRPGGRVRQVGSLRLLHESAPTGAEDMLYRWMVLCHGL